MDESEFDLRQFAYRHNPNAVVDSICLTCYLTAGSSLAEAELKQMERRHQCKLEGRTFASQITSIPFAGKEKHRSRRRALQIGRFLIVYGREKDL